MNNIERMTIKRMMNFINTASNKKASIQINDSIWEYTEEPESEWDEEDKIAFAYDLWNWEERGDYIGMILPNGEKIPLN